MTNEFPRCFIADVAKSKGLSNLTWGPKCLRGRRSRSSFIFLWSGVLSKSENYCGRLTLLSELSQRLENRHKKKIIYFLEIFFFVTKGQITNSNTFNFWNIFKNDFFLGIFQPLLSSIFDDKLVWFCVLFQKFMSHPQDNFRLLSIDILG